MATSLLPQQQEQQQQQQPPFTKRRITCRNPQWTYLKLELITHPILLENKKEKDRLDPLTARTYLTSALSQFLGLIGTAIPIDILKIETTLSSSSSSSSGRGREFLWIRVPREDAAGVVGAVSSWVGQTTTSTSSSSAGGGGGGGGGEEGSVAWRICAKGNFLGAVVHGSGGDVFDA